MKCELCHQNDAETAIQLARGDGEPEELYVCRECARRERVRRQKKSQRTRKSADGLSGVSVSVTGVPVGDGEEPPPIVAAIMNAMNGLVSGLEKAVAEESAAKEPEYIELPCAHAEPEFRLGGMLHLEGLNLIGELGAIQRAARALRLKLVGVDADGIRDSGHVYRVLHPGRQELAKRFVNDLLREERNARVRLFEEMPRVFGDSLCRALAILKNCRLLSPGELFDLLSPLRLATIESLLDGIGREEVESLAASLDLSSKEDGETQEERDKIDAERADEMNRRFEDVVLNERAEGRIP